MRFKETKCEVEAMNEELMIACSRIKFLELDVIEANAKVEHVALNKLDEVLTYQKPSSNRSGMGYTGESSSSVNVSKEIKFVKDKEPLVPTPFVEDVKVKTKCDDSKGFDKALKSICGQTQGKGEVSFEGTKWSSNSTLLLSLWNLRTH